MQNVVLFLFLTILSAAAEFSRAPYVQFATHDSMRLVWRTESGIAPVVKVGLKTDELTEVVPAAQISTRLHPSKKGAAPLFKDASKDTQQFEATITGLEPQTTYYYAIFDGDERLTSEDDSYHFVTHPILGSDATTYFWVVGDSGTGGKAQAQVHDAMISHL